MIRDQVPASSVVKWARGPFASWAETVFSSKMKPIGGDSDSSPSFGIVRLVGDICLQGGDWAYVVVLFGN